MSTQIENLTFEAALQELETIITQLESGEHTLEESLALFERGQKLAAWCSQQLEQATLRIEQLTADGEIVQLS
ncbi:MAG: exodeoxyribonuclease VII small subunit [Chloroflexi bacterium]|nr:MAG: exodeoxyribonuclease VII small subunit [Chloroflexota bacterium]